MLSVDTHSRFVDELILSKLRVQSTKLKGVKFESEARAAFLEVGTRSIFGKLITMMSEENEITLVVECEDLATSEGGVLREESGYHAAYAMTCHGVEVVENQLWVVIMACWSSMIWYLFSQFDSRHAESSCWAFW